MYQCRLPDKAQGQVWLSDRDANGQNRQLLAIEARQGAWVLRGSSLAFPLDKKQKEMPSVKLRTGTCYSIRLPRENEDAFMTVEEENDKTLTFQKYTVPSEKGMSITIGGEAGCGIRYDNTNVSDIYAELQFYSGHWSLSDRQSKHGVYVNGERVQSLGLEPGDRVNALGLTILIGSYFIAVNNPNGQVLLDPALFAAYQPEAAVESVAAEGDRLIESVEYFYRSPRQRSEVGPVEIAVDPPPQEMDNDSQPMALVLGPSITMGIASVAMGWFSFTAAMQSDDPNRWGTAIPSLAMAISMLLGTILWPILSQRHDKKKAAKKQRELEKKYADYLQSVDKRIAEICMEQEKSLRDSVLTVEECAARIRRRDKRLWERSASQSDFLELRVGSGVGEPVGEIVFPKVKFEANDSKLRDELDKLRDKPRVLRNIPVTFPLAKNRVTAVAGRRNKCIEFANGLLVQLTSLYGYDEVKTVFLYSRAEEELFAFAKWLPHSWSDDRDFRYIATDLDELKILSTELEKEISLRLPQADGKPKESRPHYVIFAFSRELALRTEMLKKIFAASQEIGFTVLCFFDKIENAPKECNAFIEIKGEIYHQEDRADEVVTFTNDIYYSGDMRELALNLANIPLDLRSGSYVLPSMITFMDLFRADKVEHLSPLLRWKESDPTKELKALVGYSDQGDPFYLDIHEKYDGPHGLVAGTTGSGKSEFIITYILSLALSYNPDEVAFLLIDFKGGGMAISFEHLPHVVGVITNLDGAAIHRSMVSLKSELQRRQKIFRAANAKLNMSNMDIYKYQKEYRAGRVDEPLPHLIIISDEFAELKTEHPDFMKELTQTARIGRSLGVHMILATQKPAGVVDDQIWSNSRFRVCLKVQDKADSMDMFHRPDAMNLKVTGRFYLQVGNDEKFALGQSAWSGAPYLPRDDLAEETASYGVSILDRNGQVVRTERSERKKSEAEANPPKQLDVITSAIAKIAADEGIEPRQLWLPPIEEGMLLRDLKKIYPRKKQPPYVLRPLIGQCDVPKHQERLPLYLQLSGEGNAIIYGAAGNGKTTFLTTLTYELLATHTAQTLNMYLVDFGSETLRAFATAPQVGDTLVSADSEKVINLIKMLQKELMLRKQLFSPHGGSFQSYWNAGLEPVSNIVVIINNYAIFKELFEDLQEILAYLAMEGTKYGIYMILTASTTDAIPYKVAQNFKQIFVLQLNDETDYVALLGRTEGLVPAKYKGRGLVKLDDLYEFQTAGLAPDLAKQGEAIEKLCSDVQTKHTGQAAKKVPVLPKRVIPEFFSDEEIFLERLPIGVNRATLAVEYLNFTAPINLVSALDTDLLAPAAQGLAELLSERTDLPIFVLDPTGLFRPDEEKCYAYYKEVADLELAALCRTLRDRDYAEAKDDFERIVYIIPSLTDLIASVDNNRLLELLGFKETAEQMVAEEQEVPDMLRGLLLNLSAPLNITLILYDEINRFERYAQEEWYREHNISPALWFGDGASDYSLDLRLTRAGADIQADLGDGFGLIVRRGKYSIAKLLRSRIVTEEEAYE